MISKKIVFVLGAGASMPYGFPSGIGLLDSIIRLTCEQDKIDLLKKCGFTNFDFQIFISALKLCGHNSIDAFLEMRPDLIPIGKHLIALKIAAYEAKSSLVHYNPEIKGKSWYDYIFQKMTTPKSEEFPLNQISFITYNYDRSFEEFLSGCLQVNYNLRNNEDRDIIEKLNILHIHGSIGSLDVRDVNCVDYGIINDDTKLRVAANSIKIIHESEHNIDTLNKARQLIRGADRVCFLGFGYHEKNLERLKLPEKDSTFYNGTSVGLLTMELEKIQSMFKQKISLYNYDIITFLRIVDVLEIEPECVFHQ